MRYADALAAFRQYLETGGLTAADLDAASAVTAMLGFYANITRQLCIEIDYHAPINSDNDDADDEDDPGEGIWQLHLTVYFRPDEENARLGRGERWVERPDGIGEFASWIARLPATAYCAGRRPFRTELVWDQV